MKCPFCQQELKYDSWNEVYMCRNPNCKHLLGFGTKELWQELIRTRKALDVAVSQLKKTRDYIEDCRYQKTNYFLVDSKDVSIIFNETNEALEQITALEQKEVM